MSGRLKTSANLARFEETGQTLPPTLLATHTQAARKPQKKTKKKRLNKCADQLRTGAQLFSNSVHVHHRYSRHVEDRLFKDLFILIIYFPLQKNIIKQF